MTKGSTQSTVTTAWMRRFAAYCDRIGVPLNDISPAKVAMFWASLESQCYSGSTGVQAQAAISWAAQVADRDDPCQSRIVTQVVSSV